MIFCSLYRLQVITGDDHVAIKVVNQCARLKVLKILKVDDHDKRHLPNGHEVSNLNASI